MRPYSTTEIGPRIEIVWDHVGSAGVCAESTSFAFDIWGFALGLPGFLHINMLVLPN